MSVGQCGIEAVDLVAELLREQLGVVVHVDELSPSWYGVAISGYADEAAWTAAVHLMAGVVFAVGRLCAADEE